MRVNCNLALPSILDQVMACWLKAPNHHLIKHWLIFSKILESHPIASDKFLYGCRKVLLEWKQINLVKYVEKFGMQIVAHPEIALKVAY